MPDISLITDRAGPTRVGADSRMIDMLRELGVELKTVIDGGANVGATVEALLRMSPQARIHSFEPVESTFRQLVANVGDRAVCSQAALSDRDGHAWIEAKPLSEANSIVPKPVRGSERCRTVRGDTYVREKGIDWIDYLKLDVEGHELQALRGFVGPLLDKRIGLIQLEACFTGGPRRMRTTFTAAVDFLGAYGFRVFRIYDQLGRPLEIANVMFVRERR